MGQAMRQAVSTAPARSMVASSPAPGKVFKPAGTFVRKAPEAYALPTELSVPVDDLGAYSWLIYGPKKIGKTTLASLFPDAVFFMFEPGAKALRIYRLDCHKWVDALGYLSSLEKEHARGTLKYKTAVVDTGFEAYQKNMRYTMDKLGIDYPREDNFGKDWDAIKKEMRAFHDRLFAIGIGVVILCHESLQEQQTFSGDRFDQIVPLLPKPMMDFYRAVIDNVAWYHYRRKERFLQIRGTDHAMAGIALQADRFFKTISGEKISAIPIPDEPQDGMKSILAAFHNQQRESYTDETQKMSEVAVKDSIQKKIAADARKRKRQ
jgi:hypothetical protein